MFQHETCSQQPIMGMPGLCPIQELPVRNHVFVMCMPPFLHHGTDNCLNKGEPVHICLIEFRIIHFILCWEAGLVQEELFSTQPIKDVLELDVLVHLNPV